MNDSMGPPQRCEQSRHHRLVPRTRARAAVVSEGFDGLAQVPPALRRRIGPPLAAAVVEGPRVVGMTSRARMPTASGVAKPIPVLPQEKVVWRLAANPGFEPPLTDMAAAWALGVGAPAATPSTGSRAVPCPGRYSVDRLTGRSLPRPPALLVMAVAAVSAAACLSMVLRSKPAPQASPAPAPAGDDQAPRAREEATTRA